MTRDVPWWQDNTRVPVFTDQRVRVAWIGGASQPSDCEPTLANAAESAPKVTP